MLVFRSLHRLAPQYLVDNLIRVADMPSRHRLRSVRTHRLEVPRVWHATIGNRTFHAAGFSLWNGLPSVVADCQTVDTFRRRLKHFFFNVSFFFLTFALFFCILFIFLWTLRFFYLGHVKIFIQNNTIQLVTSLQTAQLTFR